MWLLHAGIRDDLFAEYYRPGRVGPCDPRALEGNLCRCTAYRPIGDAARSLGPASGTPTCPEAFHVHFEPRATQPGVVSGSKAVGEPPLMLAISVREALREAVAAGAGDGAARPVVTFDSPATPGRIFCAIARACATPPSVRAR